MRRMLIMMILVVVTESSEAQSEAIVRIHNQQGNSATLGSGALIHVLESGEQGLILTCQHLFSAGIGTLIVEFPCGARHGAKLLKADKESDLAAMVINNPPVEPLVFGTDTSGELRVCGYGGEGVGRAGIGRVIGTTRQGSGRVPSTIISTIARSGDSGGPLLNANDEVVGVVWGCDGKAAYVTSGQVLVDFVAQFGVCPGGQCRPPMGPQRPQPRQPGGGLVPVPGPTRPPVQAPTPDKGCKCDDKLNALEEALKKQADKLDEMHKEFERRLNELENKPEFQQDNEEIYQYVLSKLPPIKFQYLDGKGGIHDSEEVALGGTLSIDPIHVRRFYNNVLVGEEWVPIGGKHTLWERERDSHTQ